MPKKLTLEVMQRIAVERGGKCLSDSYVNSKTKLLWECAEGHKWEAVPNIIKQGSWCRECYDKRRGKTLRSTIEEMQRIAEERGGKCLSETYTNNRIKLRWECAEGHQWEATSHSIKRGHWCPHCVGQTNGTIEEMQQIAEERGGKCLSEAYVNNHTKLRWECAEGHQWEATPHSIKSGNWCKKCAGKAKGTIEEMQQIAVERGGKCLSEVYVNSQTKLWWQCAEGHRWKAVPASIKTGRWCRKCAGLEKGTIEEMQQIAIERGGKCLSKTYTNNRIKLRWECAEGHQWSAQPDHIKSGHWCPECSSGLGERICRVFFEQLFEKKFPKHYPEWLVNQNGNRMELDGCCQSLKLAFEHQGEQHYTTRTHFITTEYALQKRQEDDKIKKALCIQRGIVFIEVPEIPARLPINEVKAFIRSECKRYSIPLPRNFDAKRIDLKKAYATSGAKEALKELQVIAMERGGKCLSNVYISTHTKLLWECAEGHQWETTPSNIKNQGYWCPYCSNTAKLTIEEMHQIAEERGGKCLSETYTNSKIKLWWQCAEGHKWRATPGDIKSGRWCKKCAHQKRGEASRLGIAEMHQIAGEHGGKCLSETYTNIKIKLWWQCAEGHKWKATPGDIKQGHWCPYCAGCIKGTIEEMQAIAQKRGGKCLSDVYISTHTKLRWQCAEGHQWEAAPSNIKSGHWCRECYNKRRGETLKLSIEEMQQIAKERGGKCLSESYVDSDTKLLWECAEGHQWTATPHSIKGGSWCSKCAGKVKGTIEEMQQIAKERRGKCLSETYINAHTKLWWQCAEGHQWEAKPHDIKSGRWCKKCADRQRADAKRLGIAEMQQIAAERGGKCLSESYVNNYTKLRWECAEGHKWTATPKDVKNKGSWCPKCTKSRRTKK